MSPNVSHALGWRRLRAPALALALCGAALWSLAHAAAPPAQQVRIQQFKFVPAALTVPVGTTVTWTNTDAAIHTVTSATKVFASDGLDKGGTFSYTFTAPGTYPYACARHPSMTGTITVQ
jgi:plastocyanin